QIVSCGAAYTEVKGSYDATNSTYTTQVDTAIEKLNIMNVVTADRVVGRMVSTHVITNNRDEASIVPECSFVNLRIAGQAANPQIDCDCFRQYGTFNDFRSAYQGPKKAELRKRIMWDQLQAGCPAPLDEMYAWHQSHQDLPNIAICSLVKDLGLKQVPNGAAVYGPIVVVPNFGIIYVCEFVLIHRQRRLNMLRVTLGSGSPGKFQGEKWTSQTASTAPITSVPPVSGGSTSSSLGSVDGELSIASLSSNGSLFPP